MPCSIKESSSAKLVGLAIHEIVGHKFFTRHSRHGMSSCFKNVYELMNQSWVGNHNHSHIVLDADGGAFAKFIPSIATAAGSKMPSRRICSGESNSSMYSAPQAEKTALGAR